jgi:hypothetical protein
LEPILYVPKKESRPPRVLSGDYGTSSWEGLEMIVKDILHRFRIPRFSALEIGVEHGYSSVVLSNFFALVVGVDAFGQDTATLPIENMEIRARRNCAPYDNIRLEKNTWQEFVKRAPDFAHYDLVHIDGEHNYEQTYGAGAWACEHSDIVLFHDTNNTFVDVPRAVSDLADKYYRTWYNYPEHEGLGILVRE